MTGEWVPFGDNAIVFLLEKLGCQDRIQAGWRLECLLWSSNNSHLLQGGYFSEYIDVEPDEERLETDAGLTNVRILEFDLLNYVNFEADIHFAEEEGIVQVLFHFLFSW